MYPHFEKKLIPTKEAAELSGYTSDYLSRLARSGKISGRRVGHTWFIDSESLERFLEQQGDRKIDYARALARAREEEYRALHSPLQQVTGTLTKPLTMPGKIGDAVNVFRSHALAFSLSLAVVVSGAFVARAEAIPFVANQIAKISNDAVFGFSETFGDIPSRIAERIEKADREMRSVSPVSRDANAIAFEDFSMDFNFTALQMAVAENRREPSPVSSKQTISFSVAPITFENLQTSALDAYEFFTSPAHAIRMYQEVGTNVYDAIIASLSSYRSLIENSGIKSLALASSVRDILSGAPRFISEINLAFGNAIISATHAAIRADTIVAYGLSEAAPASARVTVALVGSVGDTIASATSYAPALAVAAYLRATELPASIGPAIASVVFNAEYDFSTRFVKDTNAITDSYLEVLTETGRLAYESTVGITTLARTSASLIARTPDVFEDAYLGALGKSALALENFARVPKVAAVISAVAPALNVGQQTALVTYKTISGLFNSANRTLAFLLGPPPTIVLPNIMPKTRVIASTPPKISNTTSSNSYPTYNTVVQGVTQDFMNKSLASLRADILATTAGLIRPVYTQTVTNASTIQQVNMIQDLTNLIVRNGDFRGGSLTNGTLVSATTGSFTNLNGGITNIASTTITGNLTVSSTTTSGIVSATEYISSPYFIATSSSATSTFAGGLAVGTSKLVVDLTTGFVGIGTTTPGAALAVEGSSLLGNSATAGYFTATTSTASTFPYASTTALTVSGQANIGSLVVSGTSSHTGLATFQNASTSQLSVFNNAYFGGTATSSFSSNGSLTLPSVALLTAPYASTTMLTATTASTTNLIASAAVTFQNLIGILSSNGTSGVSARTLTGTANQITVTNGDGTGGNPIFSLPSTLSFTDATSTNFFAGRLTANTFSAGQTASTTIDSAGNLSTAGTLSVTGQTTLASSLSGLLAGSSGIVYSTATSSLSVGASISNSGTLGSQIGGTASSLSLNMANANSWTALQSFANASTSQLSVFNNAYFGGTATSSFSSTGVLTLASALGVGSGGTGWAAIQSSAIPYGNGTGALATTTAGTAGYVLAYLNGVPTWTATSTINNGVSSIAQTYGTAQTGALTFATSSQTTNGQTVGLNITNSSGAFTFAPTISGTLAIAGGGTGQTSFTADQIHYGNFATVGTTSPTLGLGLSYSGTLGSFVGGAAGSLTIATSSLYSGTTGQFPYFSGTNTITATSSLFLATSGNVGIGTIVPSNKLTVAADETNTDYDTAGQFRIRGVSNANQVLAIGYNTASDFGWIQPSIDGSAYKNLVLNPGGANIGIGTTSPYSLLSISNNLNTVANTPLFTIASTTGGTSTSTLMTVLASGYVGIGTTSPYAKLSVVGQVVADNFFATSTTATSTFAGGFSVGLCVTADTRMRRRRRRKDGSYDYDEPDIIDIKEGDEIQSLDEKTGKLVWSRVKQLAFMGVKQTFKLTTASGKTIRTTANHPYLARNGHDTTNVPGGEGNLGSAHSGISGAGGHEREEDAHRSRRLVATGSTSYPAHGKATSIARSLSRVVVFIDYANIKAWARSKDVAVDLEALKIILSLCGVARTSIYYGVDVENKKIAKFMHKLRSFGYDVISKPIQYFKITLTELLEQYVNARWVNALRTNARKTLVAEAERLDAESHSFLVPKANFDVEITLDAMRSINTFDHIILFSGDGDFVPLLAHIGASSKQTTVVSGREFMAGALHATVNTVTKLEDIVKLAPELVYALGPDGSYKKPTPAHKGRVWENCAPSIADLLGLSSMSKEGVDNPVKHGEGSWRKVSELKEGMEIAVAAPQDGAVWDRIVSVEPVALEDVYDVEIEGTHNFIGNDIVAHNTAFTVQQATGNVGISTSSPLSLFSIGTAGNAFRVDTTGTVKEGIWNGTTIAIANGGTGKTSFTADQLHYGNFATVATSSVSYGLGFTTGGTFGALVGGSSPTLSIATSSLYTGLTGGLPYFSGTNTLSSLAASNTNGNVLAMSAGLPAWVATTTFTGTAPVTATFAAGQVTVACSTCLTANQSITLTGAVTGTGATSISTSFGTLAQGILGNPAAAATIPTALATSTLFGPIATFLTTGNVGIASTSPYALLSIGGNVVIGASAAGGTLGTLTLPALGTAAGTFLAADATGKIIATTSPSGSGSGTVGASTAIGQFPYYAAVGTTLTATSSLFLSTASYVGIGTTSPLSRLSIQSDGATSATSALNVTDSNGASKLFVRNDGNIGVGTMSPTATLDIRKSGAVLAVGILTPPTSGTFTGVIYNENSAWSSQGIVDGQADFGLNYYYNSGFKYRLADEAANIKFANGITTFQSAAAGSADAVLPWTDNVTILANGNVGIASSSPWGLLSVNANALAAGIPQFVVGSSTATNFIVANSGNVGIGTTNPGAKLEISGQTASGILRLSGGDTAAGFSNATIALGYSTTGQWPNFIHTRHSAGSAPDNAIDFYTSDGTAAGIFPTNAVLGLSINGGKVGIGTTSPYAKLSVVGQVVADNFFATSTTATSTFAGGFVATGLSQLVNAELGALAFDTNAGWVSWADLPVTSAASAGTIESYTASLAGLSAITVYGTSNGAGSLATGPYVGIGTTSPYALLSVATTTTSLMDLFVIASSTTSGIVFKVDSYGRTYGDGAYASPAADYAEYFKTKSADLQSGEVVCVDVVENNSVKRCERGADNNVMGIVSTKPAVIGNYIKAAEADPSHYAIIGMLGQVDAYVSAENGPINVGDSLTSASSTPGYAMLADGGDSTVGIALETLSEGTGKIKVLISRRNKSLAVEEVDALVVERIANMKIEDSVQLMIKNAVDNLNLDPKITEIAQDEAGKLDTLLTVGINDNTSAIMKLNEDFAGLVASNSKITSAISIDDFGNVGVVGNIGASSFTVPVTASSTLPSDVLTADGKGVDLYKLATYALLNIQQVNSQLTTLDTRLTTLETRVTALESGAISSTTDSPLSLSSSSLASALSGLGVFIQRGIAQFGSLVADQFVAATNSAGTSSAGTVTILAGNTVAQVDNAYVLPSSKIFVTFTATTTGSWHISDKQAGSFKVVLSEAQKADTSFDYFLVQTEGQIATSTPPSISNSNANNTPPPTSPEATQGTAPPATSTPPTSSDTTAPVVTLNGDAAMQINVGDAFTDPGATATDDTDGDITIHIIVSGAVDPATAGLYTLTYTATDAAGNSASASRVVTVLAPPVPTSEVGTPTESVGADTTTPTP